MPKNKMETRTFKITAPVEAWELMDEEGFYYEANLTMYLRDIYFEIKRCMEEQHDKSKK